MPKSKPPYPPAFRQQIIELAQAGRSPAELSREFGPSAQTIINWMGHVALKFSCPRVVCCIDSPLVVQIAPTS